MVKKTVKVAHKTNGYDRIKQGKLEHVSKYEKEIDIPELSEGTEKRIKTGKAKRIKQEKESIIISCSKCGMTEEMDPDEQRHHSQSFKWISNVGAYGKYKCPCGNTVTSKSESPKKRESPKRVPKGVYEKNHDKLLKTIDLDELKNKGSLKLKSSGFMDLNFDYLREDAQGRHIIAMSHYYKHPSGDMIADPDMEIRIDPNLKTIEALTYQDTFGYQKVYSEDGKNVNPQLKKSQNSFLSTWLSNIKKQGF